MSCFKHWSHYRELQDKNIFIFEEEGLRAAEKDVLRFCALQFGPLGKKAATISLYLCAIGHAHKLHLGSNPIQQMPRVKLLLAGAQRIDGPPVRKLPISAQDLVVIRSHLSSEDINTNIMFCTIALGWFFMIRRSEYLGIGLEGRSSKTFRHTVRCMDLEPMFQGQRSTWDGQVDSVSLHLEGSKTDWLNQGTVRTHGRLDEGGPNEHICIVHCLQTLFRSFPQRATHNTHLPFARWENDRLITSYQVTRMLKFAVQKNGLDPDSYSLHSLRSGGATALYRATGDLDLVGRFGRWKGKSIHGYLWESHQMLIGIATLMTRDDGPMVHRAVNRPHQRMA